MAFNIYLRVSTEQQHYAQQMEDINRYFSEHNINIDDVNEIVEEKESGGKSYTDRKFKGLLRRCKKGDIIYAASTDRLGRNFFDMIDLMSEAKKRGVTILACNQNLSLGDDDLATRIILSLRAIIDEDERNRIRHRIKNGVTAAIREIETKGARITKSGNIQTHWGAKKGCDMTPAHEASAKKRIDETLEWMNTSTAYKWVMAKVASGMPRAKIIEEFNFQHTLQPDVYCTRTGKPLTKALLSKWISMGTNR
ncbi:MAG: recombinase family protein [Bacteroides sp.]|nr:recombinase family protein [Bacteroides sp.]